MSRIRMASGMAAAGIDIARGPITTLLKFLRIAVCSIFSGLWIAVKAVCRVIKAILPWFLLMVALGSAAYLGCRFMNSSIEASRIAAEATKHETAFNESLEAAVESAKDLKINARVRALVNSRLATSSQRFNDCLLSKEIKAAISVNPDFWEDEPLQECRIFRSQLLRANPLKKGRPEGGSPFLRRANFVGSTGGLPDVRLMVIWTSMREASRQYISVEMDGRLAYLCVAENGEDLWPWIYKGIGLWEHLLDEIEAFVDKDRQQQEIDSRFGDWKGEQE